MTLRTPAELVGRGPFYKLTCEDEEHNGLQYKTGFIRDIIPFNPSGECSAGGMYFFSRDQLANFSEYVVSPYWIREVTFTADSMIWEEDGKFKTNEFILGEREKFYLPPDVCLAAVQEDGYLLEYVKDQTPELCLVAVQQNGRALQYVKEQTLEICLAAVSETYHVLEYVENKTAEILDMAKKRQLEHMKLQEDIRRRLQRKDS